MDAVSRRAAARVFRLAAELLDSGKCIRGCCSAIYMAQLQLADPQFNESYCTPQHKIFDTVFPWQDDDGDYKHWPSYCNRCTPHAERVMPRVLALEFLAVMCEAGDVDA